MNHAPLKALSSALAFTLFLQCAGCGYILHPERRGQQGGDIDAGVAVLDGVGILLFVVPGVVAFIVDFSSGAIYLPNTDHRRSADPATLRKVAFDARPGAWASIERIVRDGTGVDVRLDRADLAVTKVGTLEAAVRGVSYARTFDRAPLVASAPVR